MTFRLNSDIFWSPKYLKNKRTGEIIAPSWDPHWNYSDTVFNSINFRKVLKSKAFGIAFISTSCDVNSNQYKFISKLREFIPVDVYGKCGEIQ